MQRKDDAERARLEHLERHRRQVEATAGARIRRALEREEAERQRGIDEFWRALNRKVRPERRTDHGSGDQQRTIRRGGRPVARSPFQLAAYSGPIVDRAGRIGVFLSSTYLAAKTTEYGCMKRLSYYVTKPDHLESEQSFFSNMGEDRHEIACGMALVEDANRAARANAKVAVTFIVQLPHDVTPQERMTILRLWCEEKFGIHNMPFVAAVHKPSADGDQRNFHGHVVTSFRPAYRTDRYAWRVGRSPRTDLDNPAMFEEYRRDFATIMTAVVQIAGKDRIYTHLSHAGRGLKHKPTEKLGPHKTRAVRSGEYVPTNARNAHTIATNEALVAIDRIDERAKRNRRRIAQLAALKAIAARSLSTVVGTSMRRQAKPVREITPPALLVQPRLPDMTTSLLAAAARAAVALRLPNILADGEDAPSLTDAPTLQEARVLDDRMRVSNIAQPAGPIPVTPRRPSVAMAEPKMLVRQARGLAKVAPVKPDTVVIRLPSGRIDRNRTHSVARRPSVVTPITAEPAVARSPSIGVTPATTKGAVRLMSRAPMIERRVVPGSQLSQVSMVEQSRVQCSAPMHVHAADVARSADVRRPLPSVRIEHPGGIRMSTISRPVPIKPAVEVTAASPSHVRPIELQQVDVARIPLRSDPRIARLDQRAREIERAATASDDAVTSQNIADVQQREHRRFVRFLALVALHPDWLADGSQGIQIAPHAPSEISAAYAGWQNDHQRQRIVAQVRQATLDGIHRVPPQLASEIEAAIGAIGPRLPPPPPLRDARGQVSPAGETMMTLAADMPPISGDPKALPSDAPPALQWLVSRHRDDRALSDLLAAARRHGYREPGAIESALARRIDQRRVDFALRRARGALPVLTQAGDRLSPAMVDHLAQIRLHPGWVRRDPYLGLGLGDPTAPIFGKQWAQWSDPRLARRLLIEDAGAAARHHVLTPAMRAQVTARAQAMGGTAGNASTGISSSVDRSWS
ncbi:MAG: MobA/MobL family protein [Pseudomonadota bacterium]